MRTLLLVLFTLALTATAGAQKRCVKGIPCGNTCISASKTCHIQTAAPTPKPVVDTIKRPLAPGDTAVGPWTASRIGKVYYKTGCGGAKGLAAQNRIYFKTEEDAQKAGYTRSTQRSCSP